MKRYVDEDALMKRVPGMNGKLRRWLSRQPTAPELVSRKAAAEILGVQSPHIARLEKQGRMPEPLPVAGTAPVYLRDEIEEFAKLLEKDRAEKAAAREERK